MAVREKMNAAAPKGKDKVPAYKLSVNDFMMKASAMALMKHPGCERLLDLHHPQAQGCRCRRRRGAGLRPDHPDHLQGPDQGAVEISNEVKELAGLAKAKSKPNQYEGGGFSVSYLACTASGHLHPP